MVREKEGLGFWNYVGEYFNYHLMQMRIGLEGGNPSID